MNIDCIHRQLNWMIEGLIFAQGQTFDWLLLVF